MSGRVVIDEQDFVLVGENFGQTVEAESCSLVEVKPVVIVSTVGNDRDHFGILTFLSIGMSPIIGTCRGFTCADQLLSCWRYTS